MKLMTGLLMAVAATVSMTAFAADPAPAPTSKDILTCTVANEGGASQVSVLMTVHYDAAADFVIIQVTDKGQPFRMFTQVAKGEVDAGLAQGSLVFMLLDENFSQEAGVIRNAGVAVINAALDGSLSGLMVAHGNIYPLTCTAN